MPDREDLDAEVQRLRSELGEARARASVLSSAAWAAGLLHELPARREADERARALLRELIRVRDALDVALNVPDEELRARVVAVLADLRERVPRILDRVDPREGRS